MRAMVGFLIAAAIGAVAANAAGAPWGWAVVASGLSGAFGAFVPGWVEHGNAKDEKRRALQDLSGPEFRESLAWLLRAEREVVPFVGRDREVARLKEWCEDEGSVPVRMLTGAGGVGKTRLAEHAMGVLRRAGWECSAVDEGLEAGAWEAARDGTARRVLLVVDYAETRTGLADLLRSVAREPVKSRVRVLLVARDAGEWWDALGMHSAAVRSLLEGVHVEALEVDLGAGLSDRELVEGAVPYFARALDIEAPLPIEAEVPRSDSGRVPVLVLHAAALIAVLRTQNTESGTADESGHVIVGDVLRVLVGHEGRLWMGSRPKIMEQFGVGVCRAVVALGCLVVPADAEEASVYVGRVSELTDVGLGGRLEAAWWLRELYPPSGGGGGWWGSLAPDLVAEHLVCEVLARSPERISRFLSGLSPAAAVSALTVLARATVHHPGAVGILERGLREEFSGLAVPAVKAAVRTGGAIGEALARVVVDVPTEWDELVRVKEAIPYPTLTLANADLAVVQRIVGQMPQGTDEVVRAYWLRHLGTALSEVGRQAEALAPSLEALEIYRRLAESDPQRHLGDLAASLRELGTRFWGLGHSEDALTPVRESVEIYRRLTATDPEAYLGELARSLINLGVCLWQSGGPSDALPPIQEAVEIRRRLAEGDPEQHLGNLAISLNNLGVALSTLDRPLDALPPALESVEIYRRLVDTDSDRYLGLLAGALSNLSVRFGELDRPVEALPPAEESIKLYRRLVQTNPARYLDDLATTLVNLGDILSALDRPSEALAPVQEASEIRRPLVKTNADRYTGGLAESLKSLASRYAELRRPSEALLPAQETVEIYRRLYEENPESYLGDLAQALNALGDLLSDLGRNDDATGAHSEAQQLLQE
jgi:DNA polymerase III delta prime subunit